MLLCILQTACSLPSPYCLAPYQSRAALAPLRAQPAPQPQPQFVDQAMKPIKLTRSIVLFGASISFALLPSRVVFGAEATPPGAAQQTGTITGRVQNIVTGNYLNQARISVKGSEAIVFTDEFGMYRLVNVRSGPNVLEVFYTDLDPQEIPIDVPPGGSVERNVGLTSKARYGENQDIVKLGSFIVSSDREADGKAVAINEQRFAPNIKNVLSTDSFGDILGNNVGEFLKFIPGLTAEYSQVEIVGISVRGLGTDKTTFTSDGAAVVSASVAGPTRSFDMNGLSLNNISRVEVTKVPTPATPADALAGSVNLVSKSAFERSRAQFNFGVNLVANSENLTFKKTPHSFDDHTTRKILPGFDFDYVQPLGKNFGITLTGFQSDKYNEQHLSTMTYNTGGTSTGASISRPYLRQHLLQDGPRSQRRTAFSFKADWRVTPNSVLSLGVQTNRHAVYIATQSWTTNAGTVGTPSIPGGVPLSYGDNFTVGATGRGAVTISGGGHSFRGATNVANLNYRFDDGRWRVESGVNTSTATRTRRNTGQFGGLSSTLLNPVRVSFLDNNADRPGRIEVFDNNNQQVDIYDIRNYRLNTASVSPYDNESVTKSANLNIKRRLNLFPFPFALQVGGSQRELSVDTRRESGTYTYNGPDGNPATPDTPEPFLMQVYRNVDSFYGFKNVPWTSGARAYSAYLVNPILFSQTPAQVVAQENYRLTNSEHIEEAVSSLYLQAEARLLNNRLNVLTGVRFERTSVEGEGSLFDPDAVWIRNADQRFARTPTGERIRKPEAGAVGSMEELRLIRQERGFRNQRAYDGYFPSLHLTYDIRENFQARLAYAKTYGRPNFSDIIPNATISERDLSEADFDNPEIVRGTVTIRNTALKPWSADNYDLSLEYYTQSGGIVSAGVFLKEIKDFFGSSVKIARLEDLEAVGLDSRFVNWNLSTKFNAGDARVAGAEIGFSQTLRMLGAWGRYFTVFANGTKLELSGPSQANFTSFIPKTANWGVSFNRKQISLAARWNHRGLEKRGAQPAFGPDAHQYEGARTQLDLNGSYQFSRRFSLNMSVSNALNVPQIRMVYGSQTPPYARQDRQSEFGVALAVGLKGSF
jgi:iron complex outermembrane recepter protein